MKRLLTLVWGLAVLLCVAGAWQPDVLGDGFMMRYIDQGSDYSGPVRSTVIRLQSPCAGNAGVLYIHGFNDYFFQDEMARRIADSCYNFYAVDLRKYGRSLMPAQTPFQVHDIMEYMADIDSAVALMKEAGISRIALMGHSTGGLIASVYMARHADPSIKALILNSPFLDWNQSKIQEKVLIPAVRTMSPVMKGLKIPQGGSTAYSHSLLSRYNGEWDYDTTWKMIQSPAVEASWIAAIDAAHDIVQRDPRIMVPILLMHSDSTLSKGDTEAAASHKDAVLDVKDISRYGRQLGPDVTEVTIPGGLHDLALSAPPVREAFYRALFRFLERVMPARLPAIETDKAVAEAR